MQNTQLPNDSKLEQNRLTAPEIGVIEELRSIGSDGGGKQEAPITGGKRVADSVGPANPKPVVLEMQTAVVNYDG